ncbi:MAG TPA: hypothetical protein VF159_03165 [Gemmatimonadaceae bacterium]
MRSLPFYLYPATVAGCLAVGAFAAASAQPTGGRSELDGGPPNGPLITELRGNHLRLVYAGRTILDAAVAGPAAELRTFVDTADGAVTQVLKWTVREGRAARISGALVGSAESFACEADPQPDALKIVRNAVGPADNRLNRAVYDRRGDWVLSVDVPAAVRVIPRAANVDSATFNFEATGSEIALRFRPRYYQRHRGLAQYRPWTYEPWSRSVAGWTSWFAFFDKVTETDVKRAADVVSDVLAPFGYEYLQIDDGYQRTPLGPPANWLHTNEKFPSGLAALERYIAGRGLKPALWTNVSFEDSVYAFAHAGEFVRGPGGAPARGNWVGYVMDGSNPATRRDLIRPVYDSLAAMGWAYLKLDALRHLRYEGYNTYADYFRARGLDRTAVYRSVVQSVRDAIGAHTFLLACWGIRPELVGLADAVRVGTDGFGYGGFAQYNSFNNVVWRNDPDHIQLSTPDAYRAASLASLTGSLLMLTDKPELYRTARAEIAKRTAPVLFTRPEQVYDVDPSRSMRLREADVALSGSGPRPLDADRRLSVDLYLLDIARPFERWSVLARASNADTLIRFADLGQPADRKELVFDFWSKRFLGVFAGAFTPGKLDPRYDVQVFCIREQLEHPQLVATNRHVSCGGPDLEDVIWEGGVLAGTSEVVGGDVYEIYVTEPAGYHFRSAEVDGATLLGSARVGPLRVVRIEAARSARISWKIRWSAAKHM